MENEFGNVVQRYRERAGLTQSELARELGVTQQTVGKWESGRAYPRPSVFAALMQKLSIPASEIMDLYGESKGARSPSAPYSEIVQKQVVQKHQSFAEVMAHVRSDSSNRVGVERSVNSIVGHESLQVLLGEIKAQLNASSREFEWSKGVLGGSLAWHADYMDRDVVADFQYAHSPLDLSHLLGERKILNSLWSLATLRMHLRDQRSYLLIIVMPNAVGMDYQSDEPEYGTVPRLPNEIVMRRLTAEAALLGISIFVTNTPRQVVSLLTSHANDDIA